MADWIQVALWLLATLLIVNETIMNVRKSIEIAALKREIAELEGRRTTWGRSR